jgi:hypothetical protein
MIRHHTPSGTIPPGADTCPGGDIPAAGASLPPTDFHPNSRTAQLAEAEAIFADVRSHTDATLRRACRVIMDLSRDHVLRQRAEDLMTFLED